MTKSDVSQLLKQIEQEYQASKRGLEGYAEGTARHDFIQKRTENIGQLRPTSDYQLSTFITLLVVLPLMQRV